MSFLNFCTRQGILRFYSANFSFHLHLQAFIFKQIQLEELDFPSFTLDNDTFNKLPLLKKARVSEIHPIDSNHPNQKLENLLIYSLPTSGNFDNLKVLSINYCHEPCPFLSASMFKNLEKLWSKNNKLENLIKNKKATVNPVT